MLYFQLLPVSSHPITYAHTNSNLILHTCIYINLHKHTPLSLPQSSISKDVALSLTLLPYFPLLFSLTSNYGSTIPCFSLLTPPQNLVYSSSLTICYCSFLCFSTIPISVLACFSCWTKARLLTSLPQNSLVTFNKI